MKGQLWRTNLNQTEDVKVLGNKNNRAGIKKYTIFFMILRLSDGTNKSRTGSKRHACPITVDTHHNDPRSITPASSP